MYKKDLNNVQKHQQNDVFILQGNILKIRQIPDKCIFLL